MNMQIYLNEWMKNKYILKHGITIKQNNYSVIKYFI